MPGLAFLPRRADRLFQRLAISDQNLKGLLSFVPNPSHVTYFDDFLGQTAGTWPASANWGYPATFGTGTEVVGIAAGNVNGALTLTTGANIADSAGQAVGLHWSGTNGYYMICRAKIDDITTSKFEIGMTDSVSANGAIATKATPTFTATVTAVFVRDTTDDANLTFITAAGGTVGANADLAGAIANDTYGTFEIVGKGAFASGYFNGQLVGGGATTAATALTPMVMSLARAASTRALTVDYLGCVGLRGI